MINDEDREAIVRSHPEMILISESPPTWLGFLSVLCRRGTGRSTRIKLKLRVPHYPSLVGAEINFGQKITYFRSRDFSQKAYNIMATTSGVSLFLKRLQSLMRSFIDDKHLDSNLDGILGNMQIGIIKELKEAFAIPSEVQLLSNNDLTTIKLSLRNVSIELQRAKYNSTCAWKVVSSDLPQTSVFGPFERNLTTLSVARNKFKLQVDIFEKCWSILREIDRKCSVIDPQQPKPSDLYRRIYLSSSLSMIVTMDPLNSLDPPRIKFVGSAVDVEKQRNFVCKNLHNWDPQLNTVENLLFLLGIDEFPTMEKKNNDDEHVLVADNECCICFSVDLGDENMPNKTCNNKKCARHFHEVCLLQWLQAVAGNCVAFDYIYGDCPNCGESISCCIK